MQWNWISMKFRIIFRIYFNPLWSQALTVLGKNFFHFDWVWGKVWLSLALNATITGHFFERVFFLIPSILQFRAPLPTRLKAKSIILKRILLRSPQYVAGVPWFFFHRIRKVNKIEIWFSSFTSKHEHKLCHFYYACINHVEISWYFRTV